MIEVLAEPARWDLAVSDAATWLRAQPDDSIDLLVTSPPYELARTYGIGERMLGGQAWVDWMVDVVRAASPKVKGLIAIVCEGQTRNYKYSATPLLLGADLHRAGFNLRKPAVFDRIGIPGSGGPDWFRNDWEPVICITRPGKLPWSNNTACGHEPKYPPGGRPSHRTVATRGSKGGDTRVEGNYKPPAKANPGNTIEQTYAASEVAAMLAEASDFIVCKVGGGQMGHELAHENEAPFPLMLAEVFVQSFCPPDGVVADCFVGSGTTPHAAVLHGRRFIGCDVRQSQIDLTRRRLATVTPGLFAGVKG